MRCAGDQSILLLGHVLVDLALSEGAPPKPRLGGIMHAARALWALDCPFGLAYCGPDYLRPLLERAAKRYGAVSLQQVASVSGSPGVMVIEDPKEAGAQGYHYLLRDDLQVLVADGKLGQALDHARWSGILVIAGEFDLGWVVSAVQARAKRVDLDIGNYEGDWETIQAISGAIETLIVSTSSPQFPATVDDPLSSLAEKAIRLGAKGLLLKENRGGARYRCLITSSQTVSIGAQLRPVRHSVGVGDCFDAAFVALRDRMSCDDALSYAAVIAAEYAVAASSDGFKKAVQGWLQVPLGDIRQLEGVSLPWELRTQHSIYIAAPDFDYVDRTALERVVSALMYHNFRPRRPVQEHGQTSLGTNAREKRRLYQADIQLLLQCSMVVAVILNDDPGTLIEIGFAIAKGIPVVVYDPCRQAANLMLTQGPQLISAELDDVITAVFATLGRGRTVTNGQV